MRSFSGIPHVPCNAERTVCEDDEVDDDDTNEDEKQENKSGDKQEELRSSNNGDDAGVSVDIRSLVAISCSIRRSAKDDIACAFASKVEKFITKLYDTILYYIV